MLQERIKQAVDCINNKLAVEKCQDALDDTNASVSKTLIKSLGASVVAPEKQAKIAIILGSGLGSLAGFIDVKQSWAYDELPGFLPSKMPGHAGRFVIGTLEGREIICLQGRIHGYEGHQAADIAFPVQVAHALGANTLIVTNAAGAINSNYKVGDIMLISDHINFTGCNPITLSAENSAAISADATSLDMTYAYTPALRNLAKEIAIKLDGFFMRANINLREGVYLGLRGPTFETPAEIRAFRSWGADAVGMSTVHEVLAASCLNMQVLGLSLLTNMAAGMVDKAITTSEVLDASAEYEKVFMSLLRAIVARMN